MKNIIVENFNLEVAFKEPTTNREASEFITNNYNELVGQVVRMGVHKDMAYDVVADVFMSVVKAEENGEGFDSNYQGENRDIEQFVYGRLKGYSKNQKYRTDVIHTSNNLYKLEELNRRKDEILNIADDTIREIKLIEIEEEIYNVKSSAITVYAGSSSTDDVDTMDSFQKAYATAGAYDDLESVEAMIDIREQIEYCLEFEGRLGISVRGLLKNIEVLSSDLVNKTLFDKVKDAVKYHDEFGEALRDIIEFSSLRKELYEDIIAAY